MLEIIKKFLKSNSREIWGILLILILGLILRLISINQSLWLDEAITANAVKTHSFRQLITNFSLGDTHPPLFYLVLRIWTLIFGYSEISLRFPSLIFGLVTVLLTYLIAKELVIQKNNKFSALLPEAAAVLLATSGLHIYYSQEARMYALSTLLVSLTVYFYLKQKFIFVSFSLLLLAMTDYLPLVILIPLWVYTFYRKNEKKFIVNFFKAHIPFFCFLVIWLPIFLVQSESTKQFLIKNAWWSQVLGGASLKDLALVWVKFIMGRVSFNDDFVYTIVVVGVSMVFALPIYKALGQYKKNLFLLLWFMIPGVLFFAGSFFIPGFSYFRLLFIIPAFYLLLAFGLLEYRRKFLLITFLFLINLVFSFKYLLNQNYWREDWKGLVHSIEAAIKDDEVVVVSYPKPFDGYIWYSKNPDLVVSFEQNNWKDKSALYTLDYLMDLTDPERQNYANLRLNGFREVSIYNFRGTGQVRYWIKT